MKRILILIIGLIGVAYGQSSPTSAKTRFVNGLYLGTKLDSYFNAADSNALYWRSDSVVMAKYKGAARALAFASALGSYKLIADTFFTAGYTTRIRTKLITDSLASVFTTADALKKNISDTFFTTGYTTRARTKQLSDSLAAVKFGGTVTTNTIPLASGATTLANSNIIQTASGGRLLVNGATDDGATIFNVLGNTRVTGSQTITGNQSVGGNQSVTGSFTSTGAITANSNVTVSGTIFGGSQIRGGTFIASSTGEVLRATTAGNADIWLQGGGTLNVNSAANISVFSVNQSGSVLALSGVTSKRGRFTSLVVNKDSVPIVTTNLWALTVDTSGTPGTNRINRRIVNDVHTGSLAFDTSSRALTVTLLGGGTTSVVIPRGTASGTSGITALSSSRTGNLVTVSGDNGSSTIFSVRDADSSAALQSLTAGTGLTGSPYNGGSPLTWVVDTSVISTKANVTALLLPKLSLTDTAAMLIGYQRHGFSLLLQDTATALSNRLRISDTLTMLSNRLKISDTATMLLPFVQYSDTASIVSGYTRLTRFTDSLTNVQTRIQTKLAIADTATMLSGYTRLTRFTDSLTAVQARIQTKQPLGNYITLADSSTILAGRWLPNRSADSITVIRALSNTKLNISDTTSMLSNYRRKTTLIENSELRNTTISGIALGSSLNNISAGNGLVGTAYNGGTAQQWRVDTSTISTKANVTATLLGYATNANLATKLNISDTSAMLSNRLRISDTLTMLSKYLRNTDTASLVLPYLRKTDTASMLSNYYRTSTATGALALKLNISDTATMLANRLRISDTLTMLSKYLRKTDTLNMLSPYRRTSTLIQQSEVSGLSTSLAAKLNISDTTSMLSNRLKISDTLAMLSNRLRISDTATMLSRYRRNTTLITNSDLAGSIDYAKMNAATVPTWNQSTTGNALTATTAANATQFGGIGYGGGYVSGTITNMMVYNNTNARWEAGSQANVQSFLGLGSYAYRSSGLTEVSDTASMLSNYARKSGATFTGNIDAFNYDLAGWKAIRWASNIMQIGGYNASQWQNVDMFANTSHVFRFNETTNINYNALQVNSTLKSAGLIQSISLKTANYTLTTNDHTVIFDVSAASRNATLPAGVEGQIFIIRMKGGDNTKTITVNRTGSDTIEDAAPYVIYGSTCGDSAYTFQFLSGNWYIISSHIPQCL